MKKIFFCLLILSYATLSIGQNSFYDAIILKRYTREVNGKFQISREYFKPPHEIKVSLFYSKIEDYLNKDSPVDKLPVDDVKKIADEIFMNKTIAPDMSEQKGIFSIIEKSKDPSNIVDLPSLLTEIDKRTEELSNFKRDTIYSILIYYFPAIKDIPNPTANDVTRIIQKNPFMKNFEFTGSLQAGGQEKEVKRQSLMKEVGGLDVTKYAQGLSSFMIERAKQELNMAFFDQFKKYVEKHEEIRVMFPKTSEVLSDLLSYKYPEMIPTLRLKFTEDLLALPINITELLSLPRFVTLLQDFPAIRIAIKSIPMVYNIGTGVAYPIDVIKDFASFTEWSENEDNTDFQNVSNTFKLASILSESLREVGNEDFSAWISVKGFYSKIIKDPVASNIYFGMLYQLIKMQEVSFNNTLLSDQINQDANRILTFTKYFDRFLPLAEKVRINMQEIQKIQSRGEKPTTENFSNYITTGIDIIDFGFDVAGIFNIHIGLGSDFTYLLRNANDLNKNIYNNQYGPAIINSINILTKTINLLQRKETFKDASQQQVYTDSLKKVNKFYNRLPDLSRYGLFIANMAEADTPEQVKDAIEAAALPVGSSAIKKYSDLNISLQSYLGAYCLINRSTSSNLNSWNNAFGITAPIGVSISYGLRDAGSISLFGSLIDIGAIVAYDLNTAADSTTSKDYKIELGQIFSPGIYFVYGAGLKLPLSLGIGAQYGPGLGKIDNGTTVINNPSWRYSIFLSVDIPMFNLFSKTWHPWKNCVGKANYRTK